MKHAIIAILLSLLGAPTAAADLDEFTGAWRGQGWVQATPGAKESLRCRLDAVRIAERQINFEGTCATPAASGSFFLALAFGSANKKIAAVLQSNTSAETLDLKGEWDGSRADLSGQSDKGLPVRVLITFSGSDAFELKILDGQDPVLRLHADYTR